MIEGGQAKGALPQRAKATVNVCCATTTWLTSSARWHRLLAKRPCWSAARPSHRAHQSPMRPDVMEAVEKIAGSASPIR